MLIKDAIRRFDETRPNRHAPHEKGLWLAGLDRRINDAVLLPSNVGVQLPETDADAREVQERVLLAPEAYSAIYEWYLAACCSLADSDTARYNTEIAEYSRLLREFQASVCRASAGTSGRLRV